MALGTDQSEGPHVILFPPSSLKGVDHAPGQLVKDKPGYDFSHPLNVPAHCSGTLCREQLEPIFLGPKVLSLASTGQPDPTPEGLRVSSCLTPVLLPISGTGLPRIH